MLRKTRKRYRRACQVSGPPSSKEQIVDHMDQDGPREYTLVKKRRQPTSVQTRRTKRPKKRGVDRPVRRTGVGHRMIIDIHLEVLDECQKGDTKLVQEDFFEILVQEFMGSKFIKEENASKEQIPGLGRKTLHPGDVFQRNRFQVQIPGLGKEDFVPKEEVLMVDIPDGDVFKEGVPTEQVPSSDSGFREDNFVTKEAVPKEEVHSSDSGFREKDFFPKEQG
ncbi:SICA antigen [Plasmodium coatneyi]|uniref:SICA antigen n=1 Tax=Plasmodium coatneyi TaxID=208452 RepID=A0A1B1DTJ1_9APIC|nr:SICA antigen [Plasmodium coatneyi]ANQ06116.1 SICA antigen [Plasmodium coatneyi]